MPELKPLYIDNHLLALDKPGGLLTQPSGTTDSSLEEFGKAYIKERFGKPGAVFLEAVHRIDRGVCGVVLFARTSKALSRMNAVMRAGKCEKIYRAIVSGQLKAPEGRLTDWLRHDDFHAEITLPGADGARECTLSYKVVQTLPGGFSLLEIHLETGRYHQIRAQLSHAGCPIVGDARYGGLPNTHLKRNCIALQHYQLKTPHPVKDEVVEITSRIMLTI